MRSVLQLLPLGDQVVERDWRGLGLNGVVAAVLLLLPLVLGFDHRFVNVVLFVAVYAVLALGLNVVLGYLGLLELGYVTFLATGAMVAFLCLLLIDGPEGWSLAVEHRVVGEQVFAFPGAPFVILLVSGAVCALLGVLRGIPTLRLTGDYYAIVTLGLAEIFYLVYLNTPWLTGGAHGMSLTLATRPTLFGEKLYYDTPQLYYLIIACLGLTALVMHRLSRSRVGRAWAAIRLDEVAARACGIDVSRYKLIGFAVSGFVGGVGGALYAFWSGTVAAKSLDIWQSILILCAVVLGGMGSIRGVLFGSLILFSLREVLREEVTVFGVDLRVPPEASFLVYGLLLIFVMRFRPQGVLPRGSGEAAPSADDDQLRAGPARLYVLEESK